MNKNESVIYTIKIEDFESNRMIASLINCNGLILATKIVRQIYGGSLQDCLNLAKYIAAEWNKNNA